MNKEKDFSCLVNLVARAKVKFLPYSYGFDDLAQEVMLDLWRKYGDRWIITGWKDSYYGYIAGMVRHHAVNAKRKVFGRYEGKTAWFEYGVPFDDIEQGAAPNPEFQSALAQALEQEIRKSTRDAEIAERVFMDTGPSVEKAKEYDLSECRVSQISRAVRNAVVAAVP